MQLGANVHSSPAQIALTWVQDTTALPQSYAVSRKAPESLSWTLLATLPGTATSWTDTSVAVGTVYEYQVAKTATGYNGYGYVMAGIEVGLVDGRGKVILIVDATQAAPLATELSRLQADLIGDGWTVIRHDVARTETVPNVKALIKADYAADPANVKAVFLFGRVPVPYSGRLAPDAHPEHVGAWPADLYYGEMDGTWSDASISYAQTLNTDPAEAQRLTNLIGDGKFDSSGIPSLVKLQVGRVDLSNMPGRVNGVPTFASETELLRQYLNKDHAFRHRITRAQPRAVVADYFGAMNGEAFSASGYRSFAPLVGAANVANLNTQYGDAGGVWIPTLAASDHLLAYGCGPGWFQGMGGIGSATDIVSSNVRSVFTLMCGSYLGDWDHEDNVMRAMLATHDTSLAAAWSGRPHWFLHPMGLGETIGYCTRLTQNNAWSTYRNQLNSSAGMIHVALMGDPTLRLLPVAPVANLNGTLASTGATLTWSSSADAVARYHVYRATSPAGPFTRITTTPVTGNQFVDTTATTGLTYMVRAVKLEVTPSGSYYNASQGIAWSTGGTAPAGSTSTTTATTTSATPATAVATNAQGDAVWFDDALPAGAVATAGTGGDSWTWTSASPAAFSGAKAHQSNLAAGLHEHGFQSAATTLPVAVGDTLFVHVYLDPVNTPGELMLSWQSDHWEHRAYWGINKIDYGKPGSASRRHMGNLPKAGEWVLLSIPAKDVGLEGQTVTGMTFSLYGGRATWDYAGKIGRR